MTDEVVKLMSRETLNRKYMEETQQVVNKAIEGLEAQVTDEPKPEPSVPEETVQPAQAGDKTDPNLLLKSLKEEREKRRLIEEKSKLLEEEITNLKSSVLSEPEAFSDEGKLLQCKIDSLRSELSEIKGEITKKDLFIAHPVLKEKWEEFEEFRNDPENKGMNLRTAAKAFLVENGLLDVPRKGLEKTTGGPRTPISSGMTAEEVDDLRKNNYKKYYELLKKGQIKIGG